MHLHSHMHSLLVDVDEEPVLPPLQADVDREVVRVNAHLLLVVDGVAAAKVERDLLHRGGQGGVVAGPEVEQEQTLFKDLRH